MKRNERKENTRDRLLEEGLRLLSENGYHGTGLKKILDSVNVPKGSFYNYFKSKEAFVAEIIRKYALDTMHILNNYIEESNDDPVTIIRNVYHLVIEDFERKGMKGCLVGELAAEIGNSSRDCLIEMQNAVRLWEGKFVDLMEQAQKENLFRNDIPAESMAEIFWCTWQGGLLKAKITGDTEHLKDIVDTIIVKLFKQD